MKLFITRAVNLLLIVGLLIGYQYQAGKRADAVAEYQKKVDAAEAALAERNGDGQEKAERGPYRDGTFTGSGEGFSGTMTVEMTVENGWISNLEITDTADDPEFVKKASAMLDKIVETQDLNEVDTVSGATFSSKGILEATWDAIGA